MKVESLHSNNQRNASHYQFQIDFNTTVIKYTPLALGIVDAYEVYLPLLQNESVALVAITKSATTEQIEAADKERDFTFRGFFDTVKSKSNHFNADVRDAAKRVMVLLNAYGNLTRKPKDEESGLITSMIADLRLQMPGDLTTLEVVDWMAELERNNNVFIGLQATRNSEEANRTELRMKEVRKEIDTAYKHIIERINALIVVNGEAGYSDFVKELNARINRANDAISQSKKRVVEAVPDEL